MKTLLIILLLIQFPSFAFPQDIPPLVEQQLEGIFNTEQVETEDDSYLQQLIVFRQNPVNLNTASRDELSELRILNDLQIQNLISYRHLLGPIIDIHELQAIPSWNIMLIRKLLPFITISSSATINIKQFKNGKHTILIRLAQNSFFRHTYQYKSQLQYGVTISKTVYRFHLFIRTKGIIQSLVLGDFTVNMGQGLIQWQSFAIKKSTETISVKRQSALLRHYNSTGNNFHRGAGITFHKGKLDATVFTSFRKPKDNLWQITLGGSLRYKQEKGHISINALHYKFSSELQRQPRLYDIFAITSDRWYNLSVDYGYHYRNFHLFGEVAIDRKLYKAILNGLLLSVDPKIDISVLQRIISKEYQSIQGNAFTENTLPSNENGLYIGIAIRPSSSWQINAYADSYHFPWLKYLVDAPSYGKDFFIQLTWSPHRQIELYTRFRNESKTGISRKQNWRSHINYAISPAITLRKRIEMVWYKKEATSKEAGFLAYIDWLYKPLLKPYSIILRLQYFETDSYDTRLYAYENDMLYSYSIPAFYNKGYRYALMLQYDISKKISFWLRSAGTLNDNKQNELKLQGRIIL